MTNITLNHKNGTIELTKSFSNASSKYGSEAYNQLQQVRLKSMKAWVLSPNPT